MAKLLRNLLDGAATIVAVFPPPREVPPKRHIDDDATALRSDWEAVGRDLRESMSKFKTEQRAQKNT